MRNLRLSVFLLIRLSVIKCRNGLAHPQILYTFTKRWVVKISQFLFNNTKNNLLYSNRRKSVGMGNEWTCYPYWKTHSHLVKRTSQWWWEFEKYVLTLIKKFKKSLEYNFYIIWSCLSYNNSTINCRYYKNKLINDLGPDNEQMMLTIFSRYCTCDTFIFFNGDLFLWQLMTATVLGISSSYQIWVFNYTNAIIVSFLFMTMCVIVLLVMPLHNSAA